MLTVEELEQLQESCSAVANSNWDGHVDVVQDHETGVLDFTLYDDDDEVSCHWTATPLGDFQGHALYSFAEAGEDQGRGVVLTLVPVAVCGLLGLA